jgi:hypothetical protein
MDKIVQFGHHQSISASCFSLFYGMVSNATFNNISVLSWWLVLLVEETGVLGESHRSVTMSWCARGLLVC